MSGCPSDASFLPSPSRTEHSHRAKIEQEEGEEGTIKEGTSPSNYRGNRAKSTLALHCILQSVSMFKSLHSVLQRARVLAKHYSLQLSFHTLGFPGQTVKGLMWPVGCQMCVIVLTFPAFLSLQLPICSSLLFGRVQQRKVGSRIGRSHNSGHSLPFHPLDYVSG